MKVLPAPVAISGSGPGGDCPEDPSRLRIARTVVDPIHQIIDSRLLAR